MSLLLFREIGELFTIILLGILLVKLKLLKAEDSRTLSVIVLYLVMPAVVINAFQIEATPEIFHNLGLSLLAVVAVHVLMFLLMVPCGRLLKLSAVEKALVLYPNCGNLTVPLVMAVLGPEWVVYTSVFSAVQQTLLWSHGRMLLSGKREFSLKAFFGNVNIIAIILGLGIFLLRVELPGFVTGVMSSLSQIVGPMAMLTMGMLIGGKSLKQIAEYRRLWVPAVLRLVVFSLAAVCMLKYSGLAALTPQGETVLLIAILGCTTPPAAAVTQISQVYGGDAEYASVVNVVTTMLCIITIPLMVAFYQM